MMKFLTEWKNKIHVPNHFGLQDFRAMLDYRRNFSMIWDQQSVAKLLRKRPVPAIHRDELKYTVRANILGGLPSDSILI